MTERHEKCWLVGISPDDGHGEVVEAELLGQPIELQQAVVVYGCIMMVPRERVYMSRVAAEKRLKEIQADAQNARHAEVPQSD